MKKQILIICTLVLGIMTANAKDGETVKKETNLITQKKEDQKHSSYLFTINIDPSSTTPSMGNRMSIVCQLMKRWLGQNNFPDTSNIVNELYIKLDSLISFSYKFDCLYRKDAIEKEIDIIGQTHNSANQSQISEIQNLKSQTMIKDLILSNHYSVIGQEGFCGKVWNKKISSNENFLITQRSRDGFIRCYQVDDLDLGPSTALDFQTKNAITGMLDLGLFPKETEIIGIEDSTIYYFNRITAQLGGFNPSSSYHNINNIVIVLRSYLSFYKMVEYLVENKEQKGSIIIGSDHMKDFTGLARYFGVKTNFYNTSSINEDDWTPLK